MVARIRFDSGLAHYPPNGVGIHERENMRQGKSHEIEPDDLDNFLCAVWFDEMPDTGLTEWHREQILNVSQCVGLNLSGISDTDPDYDELARRCRALGWDTYDSDTRLLVFSPRPLVID